MAQQLLARLFILRISYLCWES
uniref:Uncharacterized protein n=1 Tax=Anguilla anguilla TaxID=7936 RepID=A0A0E9XHH5_ANGAN